MLFSIFVSYAVAVLLCSSHPFCCARDTVTYDTPITDGVESETLVSSGGRFELGFFSPSPEGTQRYVGIWYHQLSPRTVVWVANREKPVDNSTSNGSLALQDGNLHVLDAAGNRYWSTEVETSESLTQTVTLMDSGNLVLSKGNLQGSSKEDRTRRKLTLPLIIVAVLFSVIFLACIVISIYLWRRNMTNKRVQIRRGQFDSERRVKELIDTSEFKEEEDNKVLDLMDRTLDESCNKNQFIKCVNVGLLCVQEDPNDRPAMSNVISMLDSETATSPAPKQPGFLTRRGNSSTASSSKPETINEITTSIVEGR
ncbi:hypothetical protein C1H46_036054 [Malus baccata]|uniref:non-specific serine/threonine protein kinase n=1 Tax=Malus baccata TaxID=106549 RepID=A0A540KWE0_MALBA|nr:hypothetical protein C1H46_036054 [Malus baccata]